MGARRKQPTVYLDTSVLSALCYRGGLLQCVYQSIVTKRWWENERRFFRVYCSAATEKELREGQYDAQEAAVAHALRLPYLPVNKEVYARADEYLRVGLVPRGKPGDAVQLAVCTVHEVDYLMTWNFAHLANADVQARLLEMNQRLKLKTPWMVSPESIPKQMMGQEIRRRKR